MSQSRILDFRQALASSTALGLQLRQDSLSPGLSFQRRVRSPLPPLPCSALQSTSGCMYGFGRRASLRLRPRTMPCALRCAVGLACSWALAPAARAPSARSAGPPASRPSSCAGPSSSTPTKSAARLSRWREAWWRQLPLRSPVAPHSPQFLPTSVPRSRRYSLWRPSKQKSNRDRDKRSGARTDARQRDHLRTMSQKHNRDSKAGICALVLLSTRGLGLAGPGTGTCWKLEALKT